MFRPAAVLGGVAVLAIAGVAVAAGGGGSKGLTLCVDKGSAEVALGSKQGKCAPGAKKLVIGKRGPAGPRGAAGAAGPAGAAGKPLSLAPEAPHAVGPAVEQCNLSPGSFCGTPNAPGTWSAGYERVLTYRKDAAGWVYVTGPALAPPGGSGTQFGDVSTLFYLPPGFRPTDGIHRFYAKGGNCSTPGYLYYVDVYPNGAVKPETTGGCFDLSKLVFHP